MRVGRENWFGNFWPLCYQLQRQKCLGGTLVSGNIRLNVYLQGSLKRRRQTTVAASVLLYTCGMAVQLLVIIFAEKCQMQQILLPNENPKMPNF